MVHAEDAHIRPATLVVHQDSIRDEARGSGDLEICSLCLSRTNRGDARVHPRRVRHRTKMFARCNLRKLSNQLLKALAWKLTRMLGADVVQFPGPDVLRELWVPCSSTSQYYH